MEMIYEEEEGEEVFGTVEGRESRTFGSRELLMLLKPGFGQVEVEISDHLKRLKLHK